MIVSDQRFTNIGQDAITYPGRDRTLLLNKLLFQFSRRWLLGVSLVLALYVGLPWLAPVFMRLGWTAAANVIYLIYSTQCHQLPQRSFFLFGEKAMYSLGEVQRVWQDTINSFVLRQFTGNPVMGWKVAWSDRMVSMYGAILLFGLVWWPLRRRVQMPLWMSVLLVLPMAIDGGTHFLSDLAGIGQGFRDSNVWLAALTGDAWPQSFYAGDALGSFNSWMRLLTGILFGLGVVGAVYPYLDEWLGEDKYAHERTNLGAQNSRLIKRSGELNR